jgi:RNA polymerase sigma-70 factor (ECF subfamily)
LVSLSREAWEDLGEPSSDVDDAESQLAMMLAICDEELAQETHVTLILRVLCGLSPAEIARAFLVDVATVDRRLHRGKARLRSLGALPDVSDSEGYQSSDPENALQPGLCDEALRLADLLAQSPATGAADRNEIHALLALFCFQAARLGTRLDASGVLVPLAEQDRSRWDRRLIETGVRCLSVSAEGVAMTRWHLEAGIACEHALAPSTESTNWKRIVDFYDDLVRISPSPVVKLNRALAITELCGLAAGREALEEIRSDRRLFEYPFFWSALAEIERRAGKLEPARAHYQRAIRLARNAAERVAYERKLRLLGH